MSKIIACLSRTKAKRTVCKKKPCQSCGKKETEKNKVKPKGDGSVTIGY